MTRPTRTRPLRLIESDGWPSSSKSLAVRTSRKNTRDPNGYYETLGVHPWATLKEIKRAYRRLAKIVHPDSGEHPDQELFRYLQEIYEVLRDPKKREVYNRTPEGYNYIPPSEETQTFVMSQSGQMVTADLPQDVMAEIEREFDWRPAETWRWDYYADGEGDLGQQAEAWYSLLLSVAWDVFGLGIQVRLGLSNRLDKWPYMGLTKLSNKPVLMLYSGLECNRQNAILAIDLLKKHY